MPFDPASTGTRVKSPQDLWGRGLAMGSTKSRQEAVGAGNRRNMRFCVGTKYRVYKVIQEV